MKTIYEAKQICVASGTTEYPDILYAVTKNGAIFRLFCDGDKNRKWERLQDITDQPNTREV